MRQTFLQLMLSGTKVTQAELARRLGWTPQRVGYLVSSQCLGFPFEELWKVKTALNLTDSTMLRLLNDYFRSRRES